MEENMKKEHNMYNWVTLLGSSNYDNTEQLRTLKNGDIWGASGQVGICLFAEGLELETDLQLRVRPH